MTFDFPTIKLRFQSNRNHATLESLSTLKVALDDQLEKSSTYMEIPGIYDLFYCPPCFCLSAFLTLFVFLFQGLRDVLRRVS